MGVVGVPDRHLSLADIAMTAYMFRLDLPPDMPSGLAAQSTYDHPLTTLPNADRSDLGIFYPFVGHAWHIAVIEVDVETGKLEFLRYAAVHDAGTIVNPRTLDGQVIGGTVQGLGTALYEEILYDDEGRVRNDELRALPPALLDGRADDDRRSPGDTVARTPPTGSRAQARAAGCSRRRS